MIKSCLIFTTHILELSVREHGIYLFGVQCTWLIRCIKDEPRACMWLLKLYKYVFYFCILCFLRSLRYMWGGGDHHLVKFNSIQFKWNKEIDWLKNILNADWFILYMRHLMICWLVHKLSHFLSMNLYPYIVWWCWVFKCHVDINRNFRTLLCWSIEIQTDSTGLRHPSNE